MKPADIGLLVIILLALGWAVWVCVRNRARGKTCSCDCSHCSGCSRKK